MAEPGLVVCRVRSSDPRWRGVMADGDGVSPVLLSCMAGLCRARADSFGAGRDMLCPVLPGVRAFVNVQHHVQTFVNVQPRGQCSVNHTGTCCNYAASF